MKTTTFFALMAEYESPEVDLLRVADKYMGLSKQEALRRASLQRLPFPVHRLGGSQKAPWMVNLADLAQAIDAARELSAAHWRRMNQPETAA